MLEKLPADPAVIDKLAGTYSRIDKADKQEIFYKKSNLLWIKDPESINGGYPLQYAGNNVFEYYGWPMKYHFSLLDGGAVKLSYEGKTFNNEKESWQAIKK
jgi:hypothetical protein